MQDFKHCYFVNGVTDAINNGSNGNKNVAISEGDYEYANMISEKGNKVKYINSKDVLHSIPGTGNFIKLYDLINPIILDCAYIGSTIKQEIFVSPRTNMV